MRMELSTGRSGVRVLNDAYNANPTSMAAALDALAALPARRRIAVLGTMAELGPTGAAEHAAIAARRGALGIRAHRGRRAGIRGRRTGRRAIDRRRGRPARPLGEGDAVLVKASRVAGLERLPPAAGRGRGAELDAMAAADPLLRRDDGWSAISAGRRRSAYQARPSDDDRAADQHRRDADAAR